MHIGSNYFPWLLLSKFPYLSWKFTCKERITNQGKEKFKYFWEFSLEEIDYFLPLRKFWWQSRKIITSYVCLNFWSFMKICCNKKMVQFFLFSKYCNFLISKTLAKNQLVFLQFGFHIIFLLLLNFIWYWKSFNICYLLFLLLFKKNTFSCSFITRENYSSYLCAVLSANE